MPTPANAHLVKRLNRQTALTVIREHGPLSRAELAARTGLSQPAVTAIVRELLELGLVQEMGLGQSSGGRPPIMLHFNPSARFVLGASLEGDRLWGALADLNGAILLEDAAQIAPDGPHDPAEALVTFLTGLIARGGSGIGRLAAIGVGVPGITHSGLGTVSHAPSLGWWHEVPLRDLLEERFGVPVVVENDVNLMALGEHSQGAGQGVSSLALMHVGDGIGAGILIDGALFRGARDAAGEVGYLPFGPAGKRKPDDYGLFEQHYSARSIHRRIAAAGMAQEGADESRSILRLCELARLEIPWARALLDDALRHWSYALAAIVCILNPERVILAGEAVDCGDEGLEQIRQSMADLVPMPTDIRFAALGSRAGLVGAIANALHVAYSDSYSTAADAQST